MDTQGRRRRTEPPAPGPPFRDTKRPVAERPCAARRRPVGSRLHPRHCPPLPAHPAAAGLRRPAGRALRADAPGARTGSRLPLEPDTAGHRPATPGAPGRADARVLVRVRPRRFGRGLRGATASAPDHDGRDHRRQPLPRLRHLDGARPAGRARSAGAAAGCPRADYPHDEHHPGGTGTRNRPGALREATHSSTRSSKRAFRSIAVPIHARSGAVVAVANLSVSAASVSVAQMRARLLPPLKATGEAIGSDPARTTT
jgi:hypothetical protein